MSLHEFCRRCVVTISPRSAIVDACQAMARNSVGCIVVQEDGRLCGILTDRDVAIKVTGQGKDARQTKVGEIMTLQPICISVDKSLHELTSLMHTYHVRRVPIVDGVEKVLGIVTLDDLIALLGDEMFEIGKTVSETIPLDEPFPLRFGRYDPARENTRG